MGKIGAYEPKTEKYKNYSLPTTKPVKSHPFYKEKLWTLQERIYTKLKKVSELLESLYSKYTDDLGKNVKIVIEKNLQILIEDLDLLLQSLQKNPDTFNTKKLQTNQQCIGEMINVCDTLQTIRSYENESKKLSKIKHALHELEHLIQPTKLEKALAKKKPITTASKKQPIAKVESKKKSKEESVVKPIKQIAIPKKAKLATKLPKPKKVISTKPQKSKAHAKQAAQKVTKPKTKLPAKNIVKAQPKPKTKSSAEHKKK